MEPIRLNKVCEFEDFHNPTRVAEIRRLEVEHAANVQHYPRGYEHRKSWEFAQLMCGVDQLDVLRSDSWVLGVAAGHERPIYALTHKARLVFATDIYGSGEFSNFDAAGTVLVDPDRFAPFPYNRNRLVVQYMNALDIRHEADTFDLVYSLSSIEHFGGLGEARQALSGMARVCRPGGVVMFATECIINGARRPDVQNLYLFSPVELLDLCASVRDLELVERPAFDVTAGTTAKVQNLDTVVRNVRLYQQIDYPHIVLETGGAWFTSVSLFLRKRLR